MLKIKNQAHRQAGFTIVELLIVVVIIAILAAITIVGYNGMQNRAHASRAGSVASSYVKLLQMHRSEHGHYPVASYICLSGNGTMPAKDGFATNECETGGASIDPAFNSALHQYSKSTTDGLLPTMDWGAYGKSRGIKYTSHSGETARISYNLRGDVACPQGEASYIQEDNYTECNIVLGPDNWSLPS